MDGFRHYPKGTVEHHPKWRFAVDSGGTFTDVIGVDPEGNFHTLKILSHSPDYNDASIEGIRRILGLDRDQGLSYETIEGIRFGTTVATNALLERKGGRVALLVTKGFSDLLDIGYQARPEIFDLCIKKPKVFYSRVFEIDERVGQKGQVITDLRMESLEAAMDEIRKEGIETIAVVFMHSWINPLHELICEETLRKNGFPNIFLSHKTVNLIKIVSRGQTTVVDAYLSPVMAMYLDGIKKAARGIPIEFIKSSGRLSQPDFFKGKDALLSGPAGGVVAVSKIVSGLGIKGAIGFDMGGTSTDVSRFEGELERIYEKNLGGIDIQMEMMDMVTVASGGGSVIWFDGGKMRVGPKSSGAYPGPACYGFGGPLSVTDANLITGRLCPEHFPKTFGINRDSSLDMGIAHKKFNALVNEINNATGQDLSIQEAATGFIRIANETMAMAIKEISVSRGFDVRDYALVCFGGAGGQHACRVASLLGIKKILFHPMASLMSAYGIGLSRPARKSAKTILRPYNKNTHDELAHVFKELGASLSKEKRDGRYAIHKELDLRFKGTDSYITIPYKTFEENLRAFKEKHETLFGFYSEDTHLEVVNLRLEMEEETGFFPFFKAMDEAWAKDVVPESFHKIFYPRGEMDAPVYLREKLPAGKKIKGPALLVDGHSTLVIDIGFEGKAEKSGIITVEPVLEENSRETQPFIPMDKTPEGPDPVMLEVFNNLFMGIAIEMGSALRNTAHSVNIKERQDFSCAVFDENGDLVANAPHIPVHLGSMADTVKAIIERFGDSARPDDLYLTNNPYGGGSHLPDMTVVCPVFSKKGEIIFFTASRGHHADIGGITPGSMPPVACKIEEEGVLIDGFLLARDGIFREAELLKVLSSHAHPARNLPERMSDIKAQIVSCRKGVKELNGVIERYGWETVRNYMGFIQENAAHSVRLALGGFLAKDRPFTASCKDHLDDGTSLVVNISIDDKPDFPDGVKAVIDFSGTDSQHRRDNLNAPLSVTRSAVLYVLRAITGMDIPLNSGCLKPIELIVPEGTILNPEYPCPVASGNVETSQRVVDVLLGALGVAAASQGTMNNLLFEIEGDNPYYETIAGGAGALFGCPGASGVQVHMTNTRITDPEVLETRHEGLLLKQFRLRKGSGGKGLYPGGDGVVREIKFLKPATVSIISERRKEAPYGLSGGGPGKRGENILKAKDGQLKKLPHRASLKVDAEESIIIKTPGGGGAGRA